MTSSLKSKQMWIRSKDKKEQKKEARQEEENSSRRRNPEVYLDLTSRKEEELVEQEMESLKNQELTRNNCSRKLFPYADDAGNTAKPELKAMSSDSEKAPEGKSQDMTEIVERLL